MRYFLATFLAALIALSVIAVRTPLFNVREVPVDVKIVNTEVVSTILQKQISAEIEKNSIRIYKGKKIWAAKLNTLREVVMANPWVDTLRISRTLPNLIQVTVDPKHAMAVLLPEQRAESSELYAITEDGSLLKLPDPTAAFDVPVVRGEMYLGKTEAAREARINLVDFIKTLPNEGSFSHSNVAEISFSKDEGYTLSIIPTKTTVLFGASRDRNEISTKVVRVSQVLDYLSAHQLRGRVIDASFSKKVLVRLRKEP